MSAFYEWVGRAVVNFVMYRYGSQIRAAGALAVVATALGLGVYLATRDDEDAAS